MGVCADSRAAHIRGRAKHAGPMGTSAPTGSVHHVAEKIVTEYRKRCGELVGDDVPIVPPAAIPQRMC